MANPDPHAAATEITTPPAKSTDVPDQTAFQSPQQAEQSRMSSMSPEETHDQTMTPGSQRTPSTHNRRVPYPEVAGYRCLREIGRGTYGVVWLAEEEHTGVQVAIKFLEAKLGQQWQILQAEVKQLAMLHDDPGIVQLKDFEPDGERPYYVMAFAEGGSLAQKLKENPLPLAEALPMFRRIAESLAYVHAKGIRHCDLKPGNILLDKLGKPRVADFGQAHLASDLSPALGTFFYMAPEQADLAAQVPDTRWDVYGLGALFFSMLTGSPPHDDCTLKQELAKTEKLPHRLRLYRESMERAKPPTAHRKIKGMDKELANIIDGCLAVDPARRYRNAEAVVAALDRRQRNRRLKPLLYGGLVVPVVLLLMVGGLGFGVAQHALQSSQKGLEERAMISNQVSADLAAVKLKERMETHLEQVILHAGDTRVKEVLASPKNAEIDERLQDLLKEFLEQIPARENKLRSYLLFDNKGRMLGMWPINHKKDEDLITNRQQFSWRGYYHGGADDRANPPRPHDPITEPHISQPFKARDERGSQCVTLCSPVRVNGQVAGVLVANFYLEDFNAWLKAIDIPDGFAVVVDNRGYVLHHASDAKNRLPTLESNPRSFKDEAPFRTIFSKSRKAGAGIFVDPVDDSKYVGGYMPINFSIPAGEANEQWAVIVQSNHESVIEPVKVLRTSMIWSGAVILFVALALIFALWLGLVWLLRREELVAHG